MALTPGTRLGVYEVTAQIGKGGMGEVYRATDTKLRRQVAIKILPPSVAADSDRLARFQREAEVLASLNHPHIAAIYGLEERGGITALVMELVEGDDLLQRIARGAIPSDEALPIAKQIAEALEAAHEHGIIHRDLKPANIKVRADGTVKVLDFGLAKAMEPAAGPSLNVTQSPTMTTPEMTQAGMILGTAAYMSPEQARGKAVDKRADIWAFGAVLFEMLTGQRAFPGEDLTDTLAAVVKLDPKWDAVGADVPARVRQVLRVCLQKDPRQRVQAMGDVRLALEGAFETTGPSTAAAPSSASRGRWAWMVAAAALLAASALAISTVRYLREMPPPSLPETRADINTPATTDPISFALSPDARQLVFVGSGDGPSRLWLRALTATSAQPLAGTEGAASPFWSPDSRSVGFFADGKLKRLDLGGGQPRALAEAAPRGGTWNEAGIILFTRTNLDPLFRVSASGDKPAAVTKLDRQLSHRFPSFLPDGLHFLFYAQGTPDTSGIYLGSLDSGDTTRLTVADTAGAYLPSGQSSLALRAASRLAEAFREGGWLVWVRAGTLVAQRLNLTRGALVGDPVTLADQVGYDANVNAGAMSVSTTGLVAYRSSAASWRQLTWFDRSGRALNTMGAPDETGLSSPSLSPDDRRVVVYREVSGSHDVWLLDGTRTSRFTFDAALDRFPLWSPDGTRIAFDSNRMGRRNLYGKSSSGAGSEALLLESPQDKWPTDWSPDGRFLLYNSRDPQTGWDLWVLPLEDDRPSNRSASSGSTVRPVESATGSPQQARGALSESKASGRLEPAQGRKPWVFLKTNFDERWGSFSPDGRWVAYNSNESGRMEIYLRPFEEPAASAPKDGAAGGRTAGQWQVSTAGGFHPLWRRDGKELYYLGPDGQLIAAPITTTGTTLEPGTPAALFHTRIVGSGADLVGRQYDVARDGRFLINTVLAAAAAPITLLQNWKPPAK